MHVYRLCKEIYSTDVLQGHGGRVAAGRWHNQGQRIVYCASSEALAVLELRVHLGRYVPRTPYVMHTLDVPDEDIMDLAAEALPKDWNAIPHTTASRAVGDDWLKSGRSVALRVPSIHSHSDRNILLNPEHGNMQRTRVLARHTYQFDHRLFEITEPKLE